MISLNKLQFESLKIKIEQQFPLEGFSFNEPYEETKNDILFQVLKRHNHRINVIYTIVSLKMDGQFDRLVELENIAKSICNEKDANFGAYFTCSFDGNEAIYIPIRDHQIERKKQK